MKIDSDIIVSITEANQNFSKIARIADKAGEVVIFKNNKPKYKLINLNTKTDLDITDDERIEIVASRVLKKHLNAFTELAK